MTGFNAIPDRERPREKGLLYGVRSLSTRELIAVLLRTGIRGQSVLETADLLLEKAHGAAGIARMSVSELKEVPGISEIKALELLTAFELSRRIAQEEVQETDVIADPETMVRWLQREIGTSLQEQFLVIYLSNAHRIIKSKVLFKGTINASAVYPREVFREALLVNSTNIMLVHNHPGGDLTPSKQDILLTEELYQIGMVMGVHVLDHLIITQSGWMSMAQTGILEDCMTGQ